ncbi:MAG: YraN family protein [Anaerobutyricum sp.]|nr:YraN family protein [Lachnospiraceae bacterium]MDY6047208.1 YraN family protein [Anaerobutyricum sp.]
MDIRKQAGQKGETVAASFLEKEGVRILMRNFRCKFGEIDLIAKDKEYFLVVEVKMRSGTKQGLGCEAVDRRKQRKICRTYDYFRMKYQISEYVSVRFDVVEVDQEDHCHWIKNAFEYQM